MTDTILLDVDGIIFRNNRVQQYIKHKSIKFLRNNIKYRKKFPQGFDTYEMTSRMNEIGYKTLGHTSMLIDNSTKCVQDYNDYVFDEATLLYTRNNLTSYDYKLLDDISNCLQKNDKRIGLFTNTPLRYCKTIIDPLLQNTDLKHSFYANAFTSDTGLLKPNDNFYECVDSTLYISNTEMPSEVYFIDDTFLNVNKVFEIRKKLKNKWFPIHINSSDTQTSLFDYLEAVNDN